jgi:hypothetical protein
MAETGDVAGRGHHSRCPRPSLCLMACVALAGTQWVRGTPDVKP